MRNWTPEEIKLLEDYYPKSGTLISKLFKTRNIPQIIAKANSLGIKVNQQAKKFINGRSLLKNNCNEIIEPFLPVVSPNVSYLLGLLWADGYNCRLTGSNSKNAISLNASDFKTDWLDI